MDDETAVLLRLPVKDAYLLLRFLDAFVELSQEDQREKTRIVRLLRQQITGEEQCLKTSSQ